MKGKLLPGNKMHLVPGKVEYLMQSHPQNEPTVKDEYNLGTLWVMAAVPAVMSQPQSREESVLNNFSKIGPNCDF